MIEMLLGALAEAIFGVLIQDLAQQPRLAKIREKLQGDSPEKLALQRALAGAYKAFVQKYPGLAAAFFDDVFFQKPEVAAEFAKLLTPNKQPDQTILENLWQAQFHSERDAEIGEAVHFFLAELQTEIKAQAHLKPFVDTRLLEEIMQRSGDEVVLQTEMRDLLAQIRDLLKQAEWVPTARPGGTSAILILDADDVPEKPQHLFGRDDLLRDITTLLDNGERVLLQGFGGMGKTALAATIAAEWIKADKGAVLWLKCGSAAADILFEALARPFNAQQVVAVEQGDAKIQAVRALLRQSGVKLLLLDDCWNGEVLFTLLKAVSPSMPVLMTARQRYAVHKIRDVGELSIPDATRLLGYHADHDYTEDLAAAALCDRLGHHAFAVEIAGKILNARKWTPVELLAAIKDAPHNLETPADFSDKERRSVKALLDTSVNILTDEERAVFLAFGAFFAPHLTPEMLLRYFSDTPDVSDEMLALTRERLPDLSPEMTDEALRRLIQQALSQNIDPQPVKNILDTLAIHGLVERFPATAQTVEFYRIHDLAYSYTAAQMGEAQRNRALAACLAYIDHYDQPSLENFAALRPELDNLIAASEWAFALENWAAADQFAWNLNAQGSQVLDYDGFYTQAVALLGRAIEAARRRGDKGGEGGHLGNLGIAYASLGDYPRAIEHYQAGLDISRQIGDKDGEGSNLGNLGVAYKNLGDYPRAIEHYQAGLDISRQIGDKRGEGSHLGNLGNAYDSLGDYPRAIEHHQAGLDISRQIGDKRGEGQRLGSLGNAYDSLGDYLRALEHYQAGLDISRQIGDKRGEGQALGSLGVAYKNLGDYPRAIEHYEAALVISRQIGDKHGEGTRLGNLGIVYDGQGDYPRALEHYQAALDISRQIGDKRGEGNHLGNLGNAYFSLGDYPRALEHHQAALDISRQIGDKRGEGNHLGNLGNAYFSLGDYPRALEHHQAARAIFVAIGVQHMVEWADRNIEAVQEKLDGSDQST